MKFREEPVKKQKVNLIHQDKRKRRVGRRDRIIQKVWWRSLDGDQAPVYQVDQPQVNQKSGNRDDQSDSLDEQSTLAREEKLIEFVDHGENFPEPRKTEVGYDTSDKPDSFF